MCCSECQCGSLPSVFECMLISVNHIRIVYYRDCCTPVKQLSMKAPCDATSLQGMMIFAGVILSMLPDVIIIQIVSTALQFMHSVEVVKLTKIFSHRYIFNFFYPKVLHRS